MTDNKIQSNSGTGDSGSKYSNQLFQENLQLKKILNVTVIPPEEDLLFKMYGGQPTYLKDLNGQLENINSLMENESVFDSLISNLLGEDDCNGLTVLQRAYVNIHEEKGKGINSNMEMQKFFEFMTEIVINYFVLVLMNPDFFPNMMPQSPDGDEGLNLSAWRLVEALERGFPNDLLAKINDKIREDDNEQFNEFWQITLVLLLKKINKASIMGNGKTLVDTFISLMKDYRIVQHILDLPNFPWIPGPSGINLKGGFGS